MSMRLRLGGLVTLLVLFATAAMAAPGQRLPAQQPAAAPDIKAWWDLKRSRAPKPFDRVQGRYASEQTPPRADIPVVTGPRTIPASSAPPPRRPEYAYPNADADQQWIQGDWRFVGGSWIWRAGHYATPPAAGQVWVQGRWTPSPWGYGWTEGRWVDPQSLAASSPMAP
ncbi:hypothetical protein SAMN07250955_105135 [Arboricoccus pini]|uniref:YXWGXW repeat-containing protein n=1 Tax=Arboricoccus pini TaxID=1963835 RepID=A0A212R3J4_9PROT|nr:hypothetical protein [Arboricoccus pini]SNB66560.1 hypothetical protein SAMN07250955_105135 [Arboricoccus pini]